jgi:RNA polymerase sigma-70 factor (ECF subfamily)
MQQFADQLVALRPTLVRVAHQRLRNHAWAEDAVSETLVAALENPGAFAGRAKLRTWLLGILSHKLVDQTRRGTRESQLETFDEETASGDLSGAMPGSHFKDQADWSDPQERLSRRQFMAQLDKCLKELPPQQARAFILRNWMEEETGDICNQLGISAGTLAVTLHRARNRLRDSLPIHWHPVAGHAQSQPRA